MNTVKEGSSAESTAQSREWIKMPIGNLYEKKGKKYKCAPTGTITAVYLNSKLFHCVCSPMHSSVNSSLDCFQYAKEGWIFWQGGLKNSSACGMRARKEEFMMWRNEAGRNHWKHLTRKLRACFCQRQEGMTNVSDCCLGQFFHLNKVTLIVCRP